MNFIHKDVLLQLYDGGYTEVKNLINGTTLMGVDNKPITVRKIHKKELNTTRIIQSKGHDFIIATCSTLSLRFYTGEQGSIKSTPHNNTEVNSFTIPSVTRLKKKAHTWKKFCVNYKNKHVKLDPYFFGLWLGDGTSTQPKITTIDTEVLDFVESYANILGMRFSENKKNMYCYIAKPAYCSTNAVTSHLKYYSVYDNKHIPDEYLYNARNKRLRLLAGIIDSDGTYNKKSNAFVIVMTRKRLSKHISVLSQGLGFKTSFKETEARMKRKNGSLYKTKAWQIIISGNLITIPTKIARKKARQRVSLRNYLMTPFQMENNGIGEVYGISFWEKGEHCVLLEDLTVINT